MNSVTRKSNRKSNMEYYFSVEGETEEWYLDWLVKAINQSPKAKYTVSLKCKRQKDPLKFVKSLTILNKTEIWHLVDVESDDENHQKQFKETLDKMKQAERQGREVKYFLGYSNFTFELWIILHKKDAFGIKNHRNHYLQDINVAYDEHFEDLHQYKHEANFKRCLSKLSLDNVIHAIHRSQKIIEKHKENGIKPELYRTYAYYKQNPALSIWEIVTKILNDVGLYSNNS